MAGLCQILGEVEVEAETDMPGQEQKTDAMA